MAYEVASVRGHIILARIESLYGLIGGPEPLDSDGLMLNFCENGQCGTMRN